MLHKPLEILVGSVFALLGAVICLFGISLAIRSGGILYQALRTEGKVVDLVYDRSTNAWHPVVGYAVDGKPYTWQGTFSSILSRYTVGEAVEILYRPDQPAAGCVDSFLELWLGPLLCVGIGSVVVSFGFYVLREGKARLASQRR